MPDDSEGLKAFFEYVWRDTTGFVYLPTIHKGRELTKYMYEWPRQKNAVIKHVIAQNGLGNDVFFAPSIFEIAKPEKEYVKGTHVFWVDLDGNAPMSWQETAKKHGIPEPTMTVASSVEGREHAYWGLANFEPDIQQIDSRNRALTYTLGADSGGWDANQFLRPPFTQNKGYGSDGERKPWFTGVPIDVRLTVKSDERVNPNIFNPLGTPEKIVSQRIVLGDLPELADVLMDGQWPKDFRSVFNFTEEEARAASRDGRSGTLQRLGYLAAENGFNDEQLYVTLTAADDRWGKYKDRHDREKRLLDIIAKARVKVGYIDASGISFAGLVKDPTLPVITDSKLVYTFQELSELEVNVDWMVEDLLRNEGIGIITGPPGVGKTQLCIQLGAHLALGKDFIGWKNASSPKKVLLFSLEMGLVPLKIFWNKIEKEYQEVPRELSKNFRVMPLGEGIALDKPEPQKFFEKVLAEFMPDLVIIDSLQKVTSKELTDELSVKAMLEFLDTMRIKHHTAMVFVHHNRKKGNDGGGGIPALDDMYGSRYIAANVDFVLNLRSLVKGVVTIDSVKNRLGEERNSFEIVRNENLQYDLDTGFKGLTSNGSIGITEGRPSVGPGGKSLFGLD